MSEPWSGKLRAAIEVILSPKQSPQRNWIFLPNSARSSEFRAYSSSVLSFEIIGLIIGLNFGIGFESTAVSPSAPSGDKHEVGERLECKTVFGIEEASEIRRGTNL